jgi:predicted 2-oxoglutarate/Fe(II)-dependent dioxygenase YbiX
MKQLTDFIVEIPDLIPEGELNEINGWLKTARWGDTVLAQGNVDKETRNCTTASVWGTKYDGFLFSYVSKALQHYANLFPDVSISKDTGYELLRYEEGGFYKQHVDNIAVYNF